MSCSMAWKVEGYEALRHTRDGQLSKDDFLGVIVGDETRSFTISGDNGKEFENGKFLESAR